MSSERGENVRDERVTYLDDDAGKGVDVAFHGGPGVVLVEFVGIEKLRRVVHVSTTAVLGAVVGGCCLGDNSETKVREKGLAVVVDENVALSVGSD